MESVGCKFAPFRSLAVALLILFFTFGSSYSRQQSEFDKICSLCSRSQCDQKLFLLLKVWSQRTHFILFNFSLCSCSWRVKFERLDFINIPQKQHKNMFSLIFTVAHRSSKQNVNKPILKITTIIGEFVTAFKWRCKQCVGTKVWSIRVQIKNQLEKKNKESNAFDNSLLPKK